MTMRLGYILVVLVVTIVFFGSMYLMDSIFQDQFNDRNSKYNSQFEEIESEYSAGNYERAIAISNVIIEVNGPGLNEIKARAFIGLSDLKMEDVTGSANNLRFLIENYPGIKSIYTEMFESSDGKEDLAIIYNSILDDFLPKYSEAVNSDMSMEDISKQMGKSRLMGRSGWGWFISLQIAAIVLYNRISKRLWPAPGNE